VFALQDVEPGALARATQFAVCALRQRQVPRQVPIAQEVGLTCSIELLRRELTQRLEETVPRDGVLAFGDDKRLVYQSSQNVENILIQKQGVGADCFGSLEGPTTGKDGQAPKQHPFSLTEQVVTPGHRRAKCPVAGLRARVRGS